MVIVVQLDALRHDYLGGDAPFLRELAALGLSGRLVPTFGFEPDAAYWAGLWPDEANGGAQFWYEPENSPFGFTRSWPETLDRLPKLPRRVFRRFLKEWARRNSAAPVLTAAQVPTRLLSFFGFPMKVAMDEPGFTPRDNVLDIARKAGNKWLIHAYPKHRVSLEAALQRAEADLKPPLDLAFFHVGNLDSVGHRFGPQSAERRAEMAAIDRGLSCLHRFAAERFAEVHWVIFGDHGMVEVQGQIDPQAVLNSLPWKLRQDYLVFLDSTMARFWFFNAKSRASILEACAQVNGGHWLTPDERNRYHLNYDHNRFGDEIFIADPGRLVLPNFYQGSEPIRGMHGYVPETPDQQSAFLITSPKTKQPRRIDQPLDMRRIFPTLLDLLDLPLPPRCELKSILTGES